MVTWYKAAWIPSFFGALDVIAPIRDRSSDGTIGDPAHASGVSGHNPDDTPGVSAERTDADKRPEVRAADADADLRSAVVSMHHVVDAILGYPPDRDRLIYMIYNGVIWSASNGWRPRAYTGTDKHRTHAHFSGDPAADLDGRPWQSILNLKAGSMPTQPEQAALNADNALYHALSGHNPIEGNKSVQSGAAVTFPNILKEIEDKVDDLVARPAAGNITPTPEQWAVFVAAMTETLERLFSEKGGEVAEQGAEAALRRVLGSLDGATPPPSPEV